VRLGEVFTLKNFSDSLPLMFTVLHINHHCNKFCQPLKWPTCHFILLQSNNLFSFEAVVIFQVVCKLKSNEKCPRAERIFVDLLMLEFVTDLAQVTPS